MRRNSLGKILVLNWYLTIANVIKKKFSGTSKKFDSINLNTKCFKCVGTCVQ